MAKLIIVAGVPGAGKSTVLVEAWKQVEKDLHYSIVSFGTEMLNLCLEAGLVSDRDEMRNLSADAQEEMQWRTTKSGSCAQQGAPQIGRIKIGQKRW